MEKVCEINERQTKRETDITRGIHIAKRERNTEIHAEQSTSDLGFCRWTSGNEERIGRKTRAEERDENARREREKRGRRREGREESEEERHIERAREKQRRERR